MGHFYVPYWNKLQFLFLRHEEIRWNHFENSKSYNHENSQLYEELQQRGPRCLYMQVPSCVHCEGRKGT